MSVSLAVTPSAFDGAAAANEYDGTSTPYGQFASVFGNIVLLAAQHDFNATLELQPSSIHSKPRPRTLGGIATVLSLVRLGED